jgi:hypothetical protein
LQKIVCTNQPLIDKTVFSSIPQMGLLRWKVAEEAEKSLTKDF